MGFSAEDKYLIKSLREKNYGAERLLSMFPNKDWNRGALKVLIDTNGTVDRRPDSGRPRTVCTTAIIHQVEDLSLRQQGKRQTHRTVCAVCLRHLKQAFYSIFFYFLADLIKYLSTRLKSITATTYKFTDVTFTSLTTRNM